MRRVLVLGASVASFAGCGLAGCSGGDSSNSASAEATSPAATVACARGGAQSFTSDCTAERTRVDGTEILVVRHADGGFRRFAVSEGSITAADGADQAVVTRSGTTLDVAAGTDRYRFDTRLLTDDQ
jgi:hypothetical protein